MSSFHTMAIFLGSGFGGILRAYLSAYSPTLGSSGFPWATLFANLLGATILGFLAGLGYNPTSTNKTVWAFLGVGFCGGLTTFSTLQLELFELLRTARIGIAIEYILFSIVLGLVALALGYRVGTFFPSLGS